MFDRASVRGPEIISVPFVQFKKREKHPWKSVTLNKVAGIWPYTFANFGKHLFEFDIFHAPFA